MSREQNRVARASAVTRRTFLRDGGAAAAVVAARAGTATVRGAGGANERIGIGVIGCGGRGRSHLKVLETLRAKGSAIDIVAVCDAYRPRLDRAAEAYSATGYMDHHDLLADNRVDAVCIATPDHIHGYQLIDAASAGKDAYCEKPLTHWRQFELTKRIAREVKARNCVVQVGTQGMSDGAWHQAARLVEQGAIGQPIHAECGYFRVGDWVSAGCPSTIPMPSPGPTCDGKPSSAIPRNAHST